MRVHILVVFICGILVVKGSPLTVDGKDKATKTVETLTENKSTKTAELGKVNNKKSEAAAAVETDINEANEASLSSEAHEEVEEEKVDVAEVNTKVEAVKDSEKEVMESADNNSEKASSAETANLPEGKPVVHANVIIQTTSIFQSQPLIPDTIRKVGPVELGLRNVVAASAAATEGYYMEMSSLNAETSHMITSKSEILTAKTMNDLYEPLQSVEDIIKKSGECGTAYEGTLNTIFKEVDLKLKSCSKNLVAIDEAYKSGNIGALTSLSVAADEMTSLPESCELSQNFAVGTFCIVNNLAEMNDRVLSDVSFIRRNTAQTEQKVATEVEASNACQQKMSESVSGKLAKLLKEVRQACVERKDVKSK